MRAIFYIFLRRNIRMSLKKRKSKKEKKKRKKGKSKITAGLINLKRTLKSRRDNRKRGREIPSDSHKRYLLLFFIWLLLLFPMFSYNELLQGPLYKHETGGWRKFVNVRALVHSRPFWILFLSLIEGKPSRSEPLSANKNKNNKNLCDHYSTRLLRIRFDERLYVQAGNRRLKLIYGNKKIKDFKKVFCAFYIAPAARWDYIIYNQDCMK